VNFAFQLCLEICQ